MSSHSYYASKRISDIQSPIIPIVADWIKETPGTISLGQGVVYYPPPKSIYENSPIQNESLDYHLYSSVEGTVQLRKRICEKLENENDIDLSNNQKVIVTAGANMAFMNAILAICESGDEIILLKPFYFNHEMAIRMINCKVVVVETDNEFQPIIDNIASAITDKTKAVVTISPNNPSGAVYPRESLQAINDLCKERKLYHISDEAYEYFTYDAEHFSAASLLDAYDHTISLYSLSKAYGFASWRIGYMVIPEHLFLSVKKIQDTILICPPRVCQDAAFAALSEGKNYTLSHLHQIKAVRKELYSSLQSINKIGTTADSAGAFYYFMKLNTKMSGLELVEELIKKHKIAVFPGEAFGMDNGYYIRIAYGALDKNTAEIGIQRLIDGLTTVISKN